MVWIHPWKWTQAHHPGMGLRGQWDHSALKSHPDAHILNASAGWHCYLTACIFISRSVAGTNPGSRSSNCLCEAAAPPWQAFHSTGCFGSQWLYLLPSGLKGLTQAIWLVAFSWLLSLWKPRPRIFEEESSPSCLPSQQAGGWGGRGKKKQLGSTQGVQGNRVGTD